MNSVVFPAEAHWQFRAAPALSPVVLLAVLRPFFLSRFCSGSSDLLLSNVCVLFFPLYLNDDEAFCVDQHFVP